VASGENLYSWCNPDHPDPTELERTFFQELDSKAAYAARILREPGTRAMPMDVRRDWARFLTATWLRTPLALSSWKKEFRAMAESRLNGQMKLVETVMPGWPEDTALHQIIEHLMSDEAVAEWMQMRWWVQPTDGAKYTLLTSDRPARGRRIGNSRRKVFFYPLSPNRLFCATDDSALAYLITGGPSDFAANWSNNLQINDAQKYLFAKDDSLKWHVERFFGENYPSAPLPEDSSP
jgi:hypothetical protein